MVSIGQLKQNEQMLQTKWRYSGRAADWRTDVIRLHMSPVSPSQLTALKISTWSVRVCVVLMRQ